MPSLFLSTGDSTTGEHLTNEDQPPLVQQAAVSDEVLQSHGLQQVLQVLQVDMNGG